MTDLGPYTELLAPHDIPHLGEVEDPRDLRPEDLITPPPSYEDVEPLLLSFLPRDVIGVIYTFISPDHHPLMTFQLSNGTWGLTAHLECAQETVAEFLVREGEQFDLPVPQGTKAMLSLFCNFEDVWVFDSHRHDDDNLMLCYFILKHHLFANLMTFPPGVLKTIIEGTHPHFRLAS